MRPWPWLQDCGCKECPQCHQDIFYWYDIPELPHNITIGEYKRLVENKSCDHDWAVDPRDDMFVRCRKCCWEIFTGGVQC